MRRVLFWACTGASGNSTGAWPTRSSFAKPEKKGIKHVIFDFSLKMISVYRPELVTIQ